LLRRFLHRSMQVAEAGFLAARHRNAQRSA
jgi:hypothetical protein